MVVYVYTYLSLYQRGWWILNPQMASIFFEGGPPGGPPPGGPPRGAPPGGGPPPKKNDVVDNRQDGLKKSCQNRAELVGRNVLKIPKDSAIFRIFEDFRRKNRKKSKKIEKIEDFRRNPSVLATRVALERSSSGGVADVSK